MKTENMSTWGRQAKETKSNVRKRNDFEGSLKVHKNREKAGKTSLKIDRNQASSRR